MTGTGSAPTASAGAAADRKPLVGVALEQLDKATSGAQEEVTRLKDRLACVLKPPPPPPLPIDPSPPDPKPPQVPMVDDLDTLRRKVDVIAAVCSDVISRLEV